MKEIILIFNGLGYHNICQANILLYDNLNRLIYNENTYNGKIKINVKNNQVYRMIANADNDVIDTYIYVNSNDKYCFSFKRSAIANPITFILTDYYYNLPIERGKLIIWQK